MISEVVMPQERDKVGEDWRAMVRLPRDLGNRVDMLAEQELMPTAVLLRRLIKDGVERMEREQKQGYRPLEPGEQPLQKTCPHCGDRHAALLDASTGATQCRACGKTFFTMTKPRLEREG